MSSPHPQKYITLVGAKGKSSRVSLAAPGVHFRAGGKDIFSLKASGLGPLKKVGSRGQVLHIGPTLNGTED